MAAVTVERSENNVPLPSHFDPHVYTTAAFDNFDHEEATLSGICGTHDTVSMLYQEKSVRPPIKPNISDSGVKHGCRFINSELPCQKLKDFIKPAKKPVLPEDYKVSEELFAMEKSKHEQVELKDFAHTLSRMNLTKINDGIVSPICDDQKMPSWSAFNSVVTTKDITEQSVGFLPVIPHPVTDYTTVFTAMDNFLDVLSQRR